MITQNDIANYKLEENGNPTTTEIFEDLIEEHESKVLPAMQKGYDYFHNDNDIRDRKIKYIQNGTEVTDTTATNNKIPHNWHKLLVKQKMGYMVGKPVTFSDSKSDDDNSPNEEFIDRINDILGEDFDDDANELVKGFSNKGVEWLHPYIDEEGNFQYTIIDARECIPIWETNKQDRLQAFIRYYTMTVNDDERIRVEYWTDEDVTYYIENEAGNFVLDKLFVEDNIMDKEATNNPQGHFNRVKQYGDEVESVEQDSWGKVPYIPYKNNEEMISDLNDYKELIDEYDKARSDLANDLEEIQEAIWALKGYEGQDLSKFQKNLRYYRAINLEANSDAGAEAITLEIPVKAKKEHKEQLIDDIYKFGMGVNIDTDRFGNSPSGVALQFLYSLLDLKCDTAERKFKKSTRELLWYIAEYLRITEGEEYDYNVVDITLNKSMIINEAERIKSAKESKGIVSDEVIRRNHPWVDNPQKEADRMDSQRSVDLDDI